jgi:SAM-dependent methyltransferase
MKLQKRAEILGEKTFLGVPVQNFERGGRESLIYLLKAGLNPDSKVLDIGCGVLRGGYWLIHFLDPGCYCGIEPHLGRLKMGTETILEPEVLAAKSPRFDTNPRFDSSVFGEKFDFFLAYSVWTHASKPQIQAMLDSFLRDTKNGGVFLTSYLPSGWRRPDYQGDEWHGTSHESDVPGCIYHSLRWIKAECDRRGLITRQLGRDKTYGQSWIEITRRKREV